MSKPTNQPNIYIYLVGLLVGWLCFYGISTLVGYLMPNTAYMNICIYVCVYVCVCVCVSVHLFTQSLRQGQDLTQSQLLSWVLIWFCFVWFNGISTIVGHLMPNPFYTYILNIWLIFQNEPLLIFFTVKWFHLFLSNTNTQLNLKIVLFQVSLAEVHSFLFTHSHLFKLLFVYTPFNVKQFYFKPFSLALEHSFLFTHI